MSPTRRCGAAKPDAGYLTRPGVGGGLPVCRAAARGMIKFIEAQTGRPFDWDALRESMGYIKRAAELRREAMDLCKATPAPATYWDWIASIAPINFLPATRRSSTTFGPCGRGRARVRRRRRLRLPNESYRLYFDGIMNWNKLGWLANKFAALRCRRAGRPLHAQRVLAGAAPDRADDPMLGMAQTLPAVPDQPRAPDAAAPDHGSTAATTTSTAWSFHSSRTCRAFTGPQILIADRRRSELGIQTIFFEGDVADASFYKDEMLEEPPRGDAGGDRRASPRRA